MNEIDEIEATGDRCDTCGDTLVGEMCASDPQHKVSIDPLEDEADPTDEIKVKLAWSEAVQYSSTITLSRAKIREWMQNDRLITAEVIDDYLDDEADWFEQCDTDKDCVAVNSRSLDAVELVGEGDAGLAGFAEAAVLLGVSKQTLHRRIKDGSFPEPVARLAAGPVWRIDDITPLINTEKQEEKA